MFPLENGKLLAKEVSFEIDETDKNQLQYKGKTIKILPILRGELPEIVGMMPTVQEVSAGKPRLDIDGEIIKRKCVDPSFTEEEIKALKPSFKTAIVATIMKYSELDTKPEEKKEELVQEIKPKSE